MHSLQRCAGMSLGALLCLVAIGNGRASETPFVQGVTEYGAVRKDFTGWIGTGFTVGSEPLRVTALGRLRAPDNALEHRVRLVYGVGQTNVPGGEVTVSMAGGEDGAFVYAPLAAEVILEPFTTYFLVSEETAFTDGWHGLTPGMQTTRAAHLYGAVYGPPVGFFSRVQGTYGPVNFKYASPRAQMLVPDDGASVLIGGELQLEAEAVSDDTAIAMVEFFANGFKVGEAVESPYRVKWTPQLPGGHEVWARVTDTEGGLGLSEVIAVFVVAPTTLLASAGEWWFWDQGVLAGEDWRTSADVSGWGNGEALLGYGTGLERTVVSYGDDSANKHLATYFKQFFIVEDPLAFSDLRFDLLRDDGAVVYLNGVEVFRANLPPGPLAPDTTALDEVNVRLGEGHDQGQIPFGLLVAGTNVLAVEVRQAAADSPDLAFFLGLEGSCPVTAVTRGPYLQRGNTDSVVVCWRTDAPSTSRVRFGRNVGQLDREVEARILETDHALVLGGLEPDTRYYYSVGSVGVDLVSGADYFFRTAPATGKPTRIWVLGDSGTANANAASVRDAYYAFAEGRHTDLWLMLGDNAYSSGLDSEYQAAVFEMYPEILRNSVLWPALGNHDTAFSTTPPPDLPYFQIFELPTRGQSGGVASGTERYYSFDYGNIHFVCLDSMSSDRSTNSAMVGWLRLDLEANTKEWLIAFWHHPPYTKGSHDSDRERELIEMRENVVPILEAHGVDLVLTGHSHIYERSYLMHGHYGYSTNLTHSMFLDRRSGRVGDPQAYRKALVGPLANRGTVYAVVGCSGQVTSGTLDHPIMFMSVLELGSLVLDIDGSVMNASFVRNDGTVRDYFTVVKGDSDFRITGQTRNDGMVTLTWNSIDEEFYAVQRTTDLVTGNWEFVSGAQRAADVISSRTVPLATNAPTSYYRIVNGTQD